MSKTSVTFGQKRQLRRVVEDGGSKGVDLAFRKLPLDLESAQRVLGRGDELQSAITELILSKVRDFSMPPEFANEDVGSECEYPSGYPPPSNVEREFRAWLAWFPELSRGGLVDAGFSLYLEEHRPDLPAGAERPFLIPRWQRVAPTYCQAVKKVLALIAKQRKFDNRCLYELDANNLRQTARTSTMLATLGKGQHDDFIIIPAQMGFRHRGRSIRRARQVFADNEFGLDTFSVACILLLYPAREIAMEHLHIDCAGDEFLPECNAAPYFGYHSKLEFARQPVNGPSGAFGSATGFLM